MSEYITTYTGKHFVPADPDPELIDVRDVAHALSLICRGNGHVKTFWSVAQHSIACAREAEARGYSDRLVLACLLHDAAECYLSDLPRPIKKDMPEYCRIEEKILETVYKKLLSQPLQEEEHQVVRMIDDWFLYYDLTLLLEEPVDGPEPELLCPPVYDARAFQDVEDEYLEMYRRLAQTGSESETGVPQMLDAHESGAHEPSAHESGARQMSPSGRP